jgi:hypothetical protein
MRRDYPAVVHFFTPPPAVEAMHAYYAARNEVAHSGALLKVRDALVETRVEVAGLAHEQRGMNSRLTRIENGGLPCTAIVTDLFPSIYDVLKPIYVCIEPDCGEFVATFHDADVSASGETHGEALLNLKDYIVALFEDLASDADVLGPGPKRQFEVLKRFIKTP